MKTFKRKNILTIKSIVCDRCGKEVSYDHIDFHEYTSIDYTGGYSSIFGDGCDIQIDLCQHCLQETLGHWLKVGDSQYAVKLKKPNGKRY